MEKRHSTASHPRDNRGRLLAAVLGVALIASAAATPYTPHDDAAVLAEVQPGTAHVAAPALQSTRKRLDVALPLAQLYITRSRATGDLRFLGYADATLAPWLSQSPTLPAVLVLHATILQSRHSFDAALQELERALAAQPDNSQAWLTRATVLRVLGRYEEAMSSCDRLDNTADAAVTTLCRESLRGLTGHLESAYAMVASLRSQSLPDAVRAWRYSELGEMAERLGHDADAEHWFSEGLQYARDDFYTRTAYADLLLRHGRDAEALQLLSDYRSMEPMLLRVAIAEKHTGDRHATQTDALLSNAFAVEELRGDAVHRREQARFLLDVRQQPAQALAAAAENWRVQREPDDVLILLRSAQAAHRPDMAAPALEFLRRAKLEDVRLNPYLAGVQ
jgi:tetratricopeptide (TPR) repeat protein